MRFRYIFIWFVYIINIDFLVSALNENYNNIFDQDFAVILAPVIDVVGESLANNYDLYNNFEYAPGNGKFACLRLHQLLFNELIKVIKETDKEIFFRFESLFYCDDNKNIKNTFWLSKKNTKGYIIYLKNLSSEALDAIPRPYRAENNLSKVYTNNILTLISPWYDYITNKTYSAGTRFIRNNKFDKVDSYAVFLLDDKFNKVLSYVKKSLAITKYGIDKKSSIKLFLKILRKFISESNNSIIPYLWGGASYIDRFDNNNTFYLKTIDNYGLKNSVWARYDGNRAVKTGLECSSLILRAAQIAGMPYFAKNSEAIYRTLKPLKSGQFIENGDILWYKGHVIIISDVDRNLMIESVGYPLYYGRVHELKFNQIFKNINNCKDLLESYFKKNDLQRLDKFGKVFKTIPNFLIFKLDSIW